MTKGGGHLMLPVVNATNATSLETKTQRGRCLQRQSHCERYSTKQLHFITVALDKNALLASLAILFGQMLHL